MRLELCLAILTGLLLVGHSTCDQDILPTFPETYSRYVHVTLEDTQEDGVRFVLHEGRPISNDRTVGWAAFSNNASDVGWSFLRIQTSSKFNDTAQVYAAGLMEGRLTQELIRNYWQNTIGDFCGTPPSEYCKKLNDTINGNTHFLNGYMKHRSTEPYWHQIGLILEQLSGLDDGYTGQQKGPRTTTDTFGLMLLNLFGDLEDLNVMLNKTEGGLKKLLQGNSRCSALIKLLPDNRDIYISQVTWNAYQSMIRLIKRYDFSIHQTSDPYSPLAPGRSASFSSYPGTLFSGDDFYVLGSGLVVQETTIGNANNELYKEQVAQYPQVVLDWMRNIVANRLATTGRAWAQTFELFNSGSYNNQFMVVDLKLFRPGTSQLPDGLLTVLEQLPTMIVWADVTDVLRNQSYWPSYNTPYFQEIFNASGAWEAVEKYGDWFTYDRTPRALIFRRDNGKVVDIDSMIKMMRYNDFQHDPISRCNCTPPYSAENAISARNDLNPPSGKYPFPALGHRSHGATDMKMTSYSMALKLELIAFGGPTYDPLPPFQWSKTDFNSTISHVGMPDLWKFDPVHVSWQ